MDRDEFNRFWSQGRFDLPGIPPGMMDAYQRSAYEQGKRLRPSGRPASTESSPRQTLGEAIEVAFALVGAAGGAALGLMRVGSGEGGWLGVLVLLVLGGIAGAVLLGVIRGGYRKLRMARLWSRDADERDARSLVEMWAAIHGDMILPHLVAEVQDHGRAWTMDGKGSFYFKLRSGRLLTIERTAGDGIDIDLSGRGHGEQEAYLVMIANKSAGKDSVRLNEGMRKGTKRMMWAAAQLAMVRIEGYTPDTKALKALESMRRNPRIHPLEVEEE